MKYRLKKGVEVRPYGVNSLINNDNLTDSIAEHLIASGRVTKDDFEVVKAHEAKQETIKK